jgi:threonine aldolase
LEYSVGILCKIKKKGVTILKYSFRSDYCEMAHPMVLEALSAVGNTQFDSYGLDEFSTRAGELIKSIIRGPSADVHFIAGGTLANLVLISSALRPFEAVIAPESGHIFVHETGAIEATGHKVCTVKGNSGKLNVDDIKTVVIEHCDEHMVMPRLVYISMSTESGTIYTKEELSAISEYCRNNNLYLYLDGARFGAAINSPASDLTYCDIAALTDAFYIGGTKNGALFGEALVICNDELKAGFRFSLKQRGALLAKGAAIGAQFEALLKNGLYDKLARYADTVALKLADGIKDLGYSFLYTPVTNLLIPVFPAGVAEKLHQIYDFYDWQELGEMTATRIVTSWATPEKMIDEFIADLKNIG